jgi:hypothetical protein
MIMSMMSTTSHKWWLRWRALCGWLHHQYWQNLSLTGPQSRQANQPSPARAGLVKDHRLTGKAGEFDMQRRRHQFVVGVANLRSVDPPSLVVRTQQSHQSLPRVPSPRSDSPFSVSVYFYFYLHVDKQVSRRLLLLVPENNDWSQGNADAQTRHSETSIMHLQLIQQGCTNNFTNNLNQPLTTG